MNFRSSVVAVACMAAVSLSGCDEPSNSGRFNMVGGGDAKHFASIGIEESRTGKARQARIAVSHAFSIEAPGDVLLAMRQAHLEQCAELSCEVLATEIRRSESDWVVANTSLRIAPEDFPTLSLLIESEPDYVVSHSETRTDKTVEFIDADKRLEAKRALRDRLTALLADPKTTELGDLLELERQLSDVQTEIETAASARDYLSTITETIRVELSYATPDAYKRSGDRDPIGRALDRVWDTVERSIAALITFLAAVIPWTPVILFVLWGLRRWIRGRRARKAAVAEGRSS